MFKGGTALRKCVFGQTGRFPDFRYSQDGNFSGRVAYEHENGAGAFELQISYRLDPILDSVDLPLIEQLYFRRVEFPPPMLHGLDPYEMIGEKIMACNRRRGEAHPSSQKPPSRQLWSYGVPAQAILDQAREVVEQRSLSGFAMVRVSIRAK